MKKKSRIEGKMVGGGVREGVLKRGRGGEGGRGNTTIIYLQYGSKYSNYYVII